MKSMKTICDQVANGVLCSKRGSCGTFAILAAHELFINGHIKFWVVFGFVKHPNMPTISDHIWLESLDGTIYDPTIEQFAKPVTYATSKKTKKYTPRQFMNNPYFRLSDPATIRMLFEYVKR